MHKGRKFTEFVLPPGIEIPTFTGTPTDGGKSWRIISCPASDQLRMVIVGQGVVSQNTHFVGQRTVPCFRSHGMACDFHKEYRNHWQGFIAVWDFQERTVGLLSITRNAYETCKGLQKSNWPNLPGYEITLKRAGGHKRGKVFATISEKKKADIAEERQVTNNEVMAQLFWIWGVTVRHAPENKNGDTDGVIL